MTHDAGPAVPAREPPSIAVVVPAYNAAHLLPSVLAAAKAAADGAEIVVVDPGSTDDTARVAESEGVRVIRMGRRAGPAEARNVGVAELDAEVVFFIDSDCIAHPDAVDRVREAFASNPTLVSLTGSYDDAPPDDGFFSLYMNLRHHHTHQLAARENATFWAACGAVRTDVFRKVGGFDAARYPMPMIEDIELGLRMREHGDTWLDADLHVTHLKRWTCRSLVSTEIFSRALPWSRLIAERGELPNDLNLRWSQRVAAALAPLVLLSIPALPLLAVLAPLWLPLPLAAIGLSLVLNRPLFSFFARTRGMWFAVRGWLFHQVHLLYSSATFAVVKILHALGR